MASVGSGRRVRIVPAPISTEGLAPLGLAEMLIVVAFAFEPDPVGLSVPVYGGMLACVEMAR